MKSEINTLIVTYIVARFHMIKKLTFSGIFFFSLTISTSFAQEIQVSLIEEVSSVYVEKLIAVAKQNYPRVKAIDSRISIAEASLQNAKISWLSPLSLSYVYSPDNTLNITNPTFFSGYQIGLSMNIGTILQTPANVKRAKEELKIEHLNRDEYNLSLITEVKSRYYSYLQALKNLKLQSQTNLDAQSLLTMVKYRFEKGEVGFQDFNNASTAFSTSSQSKIEAESTFLKSKAELEELLGIRLEEVN